MNKTDHNNISILNNNRNNILLIEDQLSLANDVISFLKQNNYNCFHASSLKKASSALRKNNLQKPTSPV